MVWIYWRGGGRSCIAPHCARVASDGARTSFAVEDVVKCDHGHKVLTGPQISKAACFAVWGCAQSQTSDVTEDRAQCGQCSHSAVHGTLPCTVTSQGGVVGLHAATCNGLDFYLFLQCFHTVDSAQWCETCESRRKDAVSSSASWLGNGHFHSAFTVRAQSPRRDTILLK